MGAIYSGLIGVLLTMVGLFGFSQYQEPALGAFSDPFLSIQLAANPSNGECLTTDGTNNDWTTCATGGGGGGGFWSTTTNNLIIYPTSDNYTVSIGDDATSTAEFFFDPNTKRAQFGNGGVGDNLVLLGSTTQWATGQASTSLNYVISPNSALTGALSFVFNRAGNLLMPYGSSTAFSATTLCLSADCRTSWPTGSGGSGNVATSTTETAGDIAYWTSTGATPATLGKVATTTASCSGSASCTPFTVIGSAPITISATGGAGGSGSISTSSPGVVSSLLYFTTAGATPELVNPVATTTLTASSPLSLSNPVAKVGGSNSILTLDTSGTWSGNAGTASALAANGSNCSAGQAAGGVTAAGVAEDCTDYWTEAENTSAAYLNLTSLSAISKGFFFSTTSANYFTSVGLSWSTTSADAWKNANNFWATSSANYYTSVGLSWSTTSADAWEAIQTARTADDLTNNSIEDLNDVAAMTENYGDVFTWNGTTWTDFATSSLDLGPTGLLAADFGDFTCNGTTCSLDADTVSDSEIDYSTVTLNDFTNDAGFITSSSINNRVATSVVPTISQLAYWTGIGTPSTVGSVATTSASCSGSVSCTAFTVIGSSPITLTGSASGSNWPQWATTSPYSGQLVMYPNDQDNTDVVFGKSSGATTTAPFWWDVSATTTYIGNGGTGSSTVQLGRSSFEWLFGTNSSNNNFYISSSTVETGLTVNPALTIDKNLKLTFGNASSTILSATTLCLSTDCRTSWPTGSGGGGLSTTTPLSDSNLLVYSSAGAGAAYGVATGTVSSANSALTVTAGRSVIGGALTLTVSTTTDTMFSGSGGSILAYSNALGGYFPQATSTMNVGTASALFADPTDCSAGSFPLGINAAGTAQSCTDAWTEAENTAAAYTPGSRTITVAGTAQQISSSAGAQDLSANRTWTLSLPSYVLFPGDFRATEATTTRFTTTNATATNATTTNLYISGAFNLFGTVYTTLAALGNALVNAVTAVTPTGTWDFGGATSVEMVNGTAPTVDALGEFAWDSTDNQLKIATSTNASFPVVIPGMQQLGSFLISSTTAPFFSGFVTGRTIPFKIHRDGYTVREIHCDIDGGTSIVINFDNGTGNSETITCDTDGASDTSIDTNNSVTAGSVSTAIESGTVTGAPDYLRVSVFGYYTAE